MQEVDRVRKFSECPKLNPGVSGLVRVYVQGGESPEAVRLAKDGRSQRPSPRLDLRPADARGRGCYPEKSCSYDKWRLHAKTSRSHVRAQVRVRLPSLQTPLDIPPSGWATEQLSSVSVDQHFGTAPEQLMQLPMHGPRRRILRSRDRGQPACNGATQGQYTMRAKRRHLRTGRHSSAKTMTHCAYCWDSPRVVESKSRTGRHERDC